MLLFAVLALTIYGVFYGEDIGAMMDAIKKADIRWLLPGIGLVIVYIWGESAIIGYMMRSFGIYLKKRLCFLFSAVGFFFCCITPAAGGGQPMQVYFMKKENVPVPVAAVILMVVTITFKLVLVVIGVCIPIFANDFMHRYLEGILPVFYLGLALNIFCVSFMSVLVFHPVLAEQILLKGMDWLEKMHILRGRKSKLYRQKIQDSMGVYRETAAYLKNHKMVILNVLLLTFVQRIALFAVTWTVYQSFGLSGTSASDVVLLQASIAVAGDMIPLPGGIGISETLFLRTFVPVFGPLLLPAMVLSRGISYYAQLLVSAFFTVVAQAYYTFKPRMGTRVKQLECKNPGGMRMNGSGS